MILKFILVDTELVLSLISIAFFESYFLVLGSILESDRNEKVFNSIALKNRPIAMIKGICSNADVRNLYFKKNIRNSNKIFERAFFGVKSCFDIVFKKLRKTFSSKNTMQYENFYSSFTLPTDRTLCTCHDRIFVVLKYSFSVSLT